MYYLRVVAILELVTTLLLWFYLNVSALNNVLNSPTFGNNKIMRFCF